MCMSMRHLFLALGLCGLATPVLGTGPLHVDVPAAASSASLRLVAPDGSVGERHFDRATDAAAIDPRTLIGAAAADGAYRYEITFGRKLDPAVEAATSAARRAGSAEMPADFPAALPAVSGSFVVVDGTILDSAAIEPRASSAARPKSSVSPNDQVIADDLIVQGSLCVGLDCVNNENFGFDTIRIKENNTRIKFEDTSAAAGFASDDWQLTANDSPSGGLNRFSIENITAARIPFTVVGAAPTHSLYVDDSGRVGLRTSTPVLDLQITTGNTPAMRLEQTNASGFTAQTWDVASNEANFFIRDVTAGSRLPFRIRPGAPTSAIDIAASGNVGIGTASPQAKLHVNGDAYVAGTLTQLSSRMSKTNLVAVAADNVLDRLARLPIWTWSYLRSDGDDRHIGPVAEDFYAAFGFGTSERQLAPGDVAGVALAATQALQRQVAERDRTIAALESRLERLEKLLPQRDTGTQSATAGH